MNQCDLNDEQWVLLKESVIFGTGRPSQLELRAIFYAMHTGCQWRAEPHDLLPWSTAYSCFYHWSWNGTLDKVHAALRDRVRAWAGKSMQLSEGIPHRRGRGSSAVCRRRRRRAGCGRRHSARQVLRHRRSRFAKRQTLRFARPTHGGSILAIVSG